MLVNSCNSSYLGGRGWMTVVWGQPGQKCQILSEKQAKGKRTGDVALVVEHLTDKSVALNSIPSSANN
jgi:hypothetical protein